MASRTSTGSGRRSQSTSRPRSEKKQSSRTETVGRNVAAIRDVVMKSMLAPLNAVLLTRRHIEEVVEDAVRRGRMTRDDAQQLMQSLLQRGAKQTDDFLTDLERLLGRGRLVDQGGPDSRRQTGGRTRSRRPASSLPIPNYDDLSAAGVLEQLGGLTPAQLRKLRDYERRHANRKTV